MRCHHFGDGDPQRVGSTDRHGTCMNGPHTALAAVLPVGPAKAFDFGTLEVPRAGDARTPCRARHPVDPGGVAVRPERTATRVRTVCKAITFTTAKATALMGDGRRIGKRAWGRARPRQPRPRAVVPGFTGPVDSRHVQRQRLTCPNQTPSPSISTPCP